MNNLFGITFIENEKKEMWLTSYRQSLLIKI